MTLCISGPYSVLEINFFAGCKSFYLVLKVVAKLTYQGEGGGGGSMASGITISYLYRCENVFYQSVDQNYQFWKFHWLTGGVDTVIKRQNDTLSLCSHSHNDVPCTPPPPMDLTGTYPWPQYAPPPPPPDLEERIHGCSTGCSAPVHNDTLKLKK